MKKVILAVLLVSVSLAACTNSSTEGEASKCDSTNIDSCVVEFEADSACCIDSAQ